MMFSRRLSGMLLVVFFVISFQSACAQRTSGQTGLGVMIGSPTGISLKTYTSETTAIDAGLAWSLGRYDAVNLHADYLWHNFNVFEDVERGRLPFYYGIGGRLVFADDYPDPGDNNVVLGARIPLGLNYLFEDHPIGLFLEFAPIVNIIPSTDFDLDGAIGARYYF